MSLSQTGLRPETERNDVKPRKTTSSSSGSKLQWCLLNVFNTKPPQTHKTTTETRNSQRDTKPQRDTKQPQRHTTTRTKNNQRNIKPPET